MNINYHQLNQFIKKQKKYIVDFINNPNEFVKQVIVFATQEKNHTDLAKHLNLPESLVKSLVYIIKHHKLEKKCKSFETFLINLTDSEQFYQSFINPTTTELKGIHINFWLQEENFSEDSWFDFNEPIVVFYPIKPDLYCDVSMAVYDNQTWELNLRNITGNKKSYAVAETTEEKKEILKMLELIVKYMGF